MPQLLRALPPDRKLPPPSHPERASNRSASIEPPKMRVVSKGWTVREELRRQEEVAAGLGDGHR